MRNDIRHPSSIPIALKVGHHDGTRRGFLRNVSAAGLSFDVARRITRGTKIVFYVPSLSSQPVGRGRVVWSRPLRASYRLGVEFESVKDAYRTRMVEQICQIEDYRQKVLANEGRELGSEEAAFEWIDAHAEEFHRRFS